MLKNKNIRITGGTGSFGYAFVPMTLAKYSPQRLVIYSRDEMKQWEMAKLFADDPRVRFFIGDVRDKDRLHRALDDIDFVVHAAATKIVPTAEYHPFECVKTNINGAMNLIDACIDKQVKRVVALSTDKASSPANLYGATKLASDKLFVAGNAYVGGHDTRVAKDIKKGEVFTEENIRSVRPGYGMHPKYLNDVLGAVADQDYAFGDRFVSSFIKKELKSWFV